MKLQKCKSGNTLMSPPPFCSYRVFSIWRLIYLLIKHAVNTTQANGLTMVALFHDQQDRWLHSVGLFVVCFMRLNDKQNWSTEDSYNSSRGPTAGGQGWTDTKPSMKNNNYISQSTTYKLMLRF
jgi:hypothetical protein